MQRLEKILEAAGGFQVDGIVKKIEAMYHIKNAAVVREKVNELLKDLFAEGAIQ